MSSKNGEKKGDKLECMNYTGLASICTAYKMFANILCNSLEPITERIMENTKQDSDQADLQQTNCSL
jgi:hypothetical protein